METLGALCDKLTIIKLKQWHTTDRIKSDSLANQQKATAEEIDTFLLNALRGEILSCYFPVVRSQQRAVFDCVKTLRVTLPFQNHRHVTIRLDGGRN